MGSGFGGLTAAKALAKDSSLRIVLLDRRNYHLFQPLLYQVATAALSPADIAVPIRSVFSKQPNVFVYLANAISIDKSNRRLITSTGEFNYDFLILACGAKNSYISHPEWEEMAPGLKTLEQATEIRRRVLLSFEEAEKQPTREQQRFFLTFVIIGGGPTGVELAGAIAEISRFTLDRDFRNIDPTSTRVVLIEAGPRLLAGFDPVSSKRAHRDLEVLGVQILTNSRVTEVHSTGVRLGEEVIRAHTIIWAAGVQASSLGKSLDVPVDSMGRVIVNPD